MKKILSVVVALVATMSISAQRIVVVTGSNTKTCQTLKDAIDGSSNGSVIYLPGGGFQIHDSVKITKRVTIMGIGHKALSENADGNTVISGNLFFNAGSSNSAVMGCYISGNINIGNDGSSVNNTLVKYCNLNAIEVHNNTCTGTIVNQNYLRGESNFHKTDVEFTNNIVYRLSYVKGGIIKNCIFLDSSYSNCFYYNTESTIANNVVMVTIGCSGTVVNNMYRGNFGDDCVNITDSYNKLFVNNAGVTPASDFHFTDDYKQYSDIGIYGGTGFSDGALPPVPYVVEKSIPEQTDAAGKLNIKIRVRASE